MQLTLNERSDHLGSLSYREALCYTVHGVRRTISCSDNRRISDFARKFLMRLCSFACVSVLVALLFLVYTPRLHCFRGNPAICPGCSGMIIDQLMK